MNIEKKNIFLQNTKRELPYTSQQKRVSHDYPVRENPHQHVQRILDQLMRCQERDLSSEQVAAIRCKSGLYLEFEGVASKEMKVNSLEDLRQGIRLLNVREDEGVIKATVYVPEGKESCFLRKAEAYRDSIDIAETPKNNDLICSIEKISVAVVESFWVGEKSMIPTQSKSWCEIWLRFDKQNVKIAKEDFRECCEQNNIDCKEQYIKFPERLVFLAHTNREDIKNLIVGCDFVAEIRKAPETTNFFDELSGAEQNEWVQELIQRTIFNETNTAVCLLDTGLEGGHPLIKPALVNNGIQSVNPSWGINDQQGHGTEMAGIAIYYDLQKKLGSSDDIDINHQIESVKILPPNGSNAPELYGAITEQAVAMTEIQNSSLERCFCMAVTAPTDSVSDGRPSSWSRALDGIAAGVDNGDSKRLIIVSAGNVEPSEFVTSLYPDANRLHGVENPAQAWNALTVGAYNDDVQIVDKGLNGFMPVAESGELSPYSSTSLMWDKKWPVKPEILCNGSNVATNGEDYTNCMDFSLLTTSHKYLQHSFSTIWATSAATAQASWMAAELFAVYPGIWPETVRGLIVHSARWTEKMKHQFCKDDKKTTGRKELIRTCGYGIPNLNKAIQCMNNSVNMIIQDELQPFTKKENVYKMNEMNIHALPWPKNILEALGSTEAELKVTLSYFIEPGPGEIGWKDKYRYQSCGLRFDVINADEGIEDFEKRINIYMRGDDKNDKGEGTSGSERWYLGSDNRDVGSIHSDYMKLSAADLSEINQIAVYPVVGWWRERHHLDKYDSKVRYSLVVSISTPESNVDLYTSILTQIKNTVDITIPAV